MEDVTLLEQNRTKEWGNETLPVLIAELSPDGNFLYCSGNLIFPDGRLPEQLVGLNFFKAFPMATETPVLLREALSNRRIEKTIDAFGNTYQISIDPKLDADGELRSLFCVAIDTTEKRKLVSQLRINKAALDSSVSGKSIVDMEGNIVYLNAAAEKMWGYEKHEVIGKPARFFWCDEEEAAKEFLTQIERGGGFGLLNARKKDGSVFPIQFSASLIPDDDGNPTYMMGSFIDLSNQLAISNELKQRDELLSHIANNIPGLITRYQLYPDGTQKCLYITQGVEDLYGLSKEEVIENLERKWERVYKEDRERLFHEFQESARTESYIETQWRVMHPSGKTLQLLAKGVPERQDDGSCIWDFVILNVTPERLKEAELEASRERLNLVLEATKDGIYDIDFQLHEVHLSPRCEELLGMTTEAFERGEWLQRVGKEFRDMVKEHVKHDDPLQETFRLEYTYERRPGEFIWIEESGKILRSKEGNLLRIAGAMSDITHSKKQQEDLRESEERYNLAVAGSSDGIWDWKVKEDVAYFSPRYKEMVGLADGEYIDGLASLNAVIHPEDMATTIVAIEKHFSERTPFKHEYRISVSGEYRWFLVRGQAVWNAQGEPVRMAGSLTDIHDGKLARLELERTNEFLRQSEARFKAFMDNSPMASWITTPSGFIEYASKQYFNLYKADPDTVGRHVSDLFPEELSEIYQRNSQLVLATGESMETIEPGIRPDGNIGDFLVYKFPIPKGDRHFSIGGVALDITEKKEVENHLRFERGFIEQLVTNMTDGFVMVDTEGVHISCNQAFLDMTGYTRAEILSSGLPHKYWPEEEIGKIKEAYDAFQDGIHLGIEYSFQLVFCRKNGERFPVILNPSVVFGDDGEPKIFFATVKDITDLKQAELDLLEKNEALEKANAELDRIVYSTSHDLRAPLLSVMGLIELAARFYPENEELGEIFNMMKRGLHRSDTTIKAILDYSRNVRLESITESVDVGWEVESYIETIQYMPEAMGITFKIDIQDQQVFFTDRMRFTTILHNLITNAIKYQRQESENKHVRVTFRTEDRLGILEVEDNGEGIPAENYETIFQMFVRHSSKSIGSGLGLYMCREMVKKVGGTIDVSSKVGEGTIFAVRIPNRLP